MHAKLHITFFFQEERRQREEEEMRKKAEEAAAAEPAASFKVQTQSDYITCVIGSSE